MPVQRPSRGLDVLGNSRSGPRVSPVAGSLVQRMPPTTTRWRRESRERVRREPEVRTDTNGPEGRGHPDTACPGASGPRADGASCKGGRLRSLAEMDLRLEPLAVGGHPPSMRRCAIWATLSLVDVRACERTKMGGMIRHDPESRGQTTGSGQRCWSA
jgi:hypothetical protein